jgi:hypothetical protein
MDEKKKPVNGTFTQVPNVFLDTCDLPETAQILYLRLLRKIGYKDGKFTGSIRDLSKFVRMSKDTADRMSKKLKEAGLINLERKEAGTMTITINTEKLWSLNRYYYDHPVANWDTKLPEVSQFETQLSQNTTPSSQSSSQNTTKSSQIETQTGSNRGGNTNKTFTNTNKTASSFSSSSEKPSFLVDEETRQRNIERLRAGRKDATQC